MQPDVVPRRYLLPVQLRYRFRVYPTAPQRSALARVFGCVRVVYNDAVAARRRAYETGEPYPSGALLQRMLITEAKRTSRREWLAEVSNIPLQQAVRDCDQAYRNFFDSLKGKRAGARVGPPRFKRRSTRQSARFTRNGFALRDNGRLRLAKIGEVRVAWSRELPVQPSSVTLIKTPTGKYYASFVVAVEDGTTALDPVDADTGVDLGLKDFAVLRGGKVVANPRFFRCMERRLKKAQRRLARKRPGSQNREKARAAVARVHERVANRRTDWLHKQVIGILRENQAVFVEDLPVRALARGRRAKSVHDAAFGRFLAMLESKAHRTGRTFVRVDRWFPSTQLCSACGALTGPRGQQELSAREWACGCGAVHDRDTNAEINLRREGRRLVAARHAETQNASGGPVRPGMPGTARDPR